MAESWKWKIISTSEVRRFATEFEKSVDLYDISDDPKQFPARTSMLCEIGTEDIVLAELTLSPHSPPFFYRKRIWRYSASTSNKAALFVLQSPMLVRHKIEGEFCRYPRESGGEYADDHTFFLARLWEARKRQKIARKFLESISPCP